MVATQVYGMLLRAQTAALLAILSGIPKEESLLAGWTPEFTRKMLVSCWQRLPLSQKIGLLHEENTRKLIAQGKAPGAEPAFDPEKALAEAIVQAGKTLSESGYEFFEGEDGHFWVNEAADTQSEYFPTRDDAILSAAIDTCPMLEGEHEEKGA